MIDGEAVACGTDGIACFELIRRWDTDETIFMWAFDLDRRICDVIRSSSVNESF